MDSVLKLLILVTILFFGIAFAVHAIPGGLVLIGLSLAILGREAESHKASYAGIFFLVFGTLIWYRMSTTLI